jgi:hypothetical protein
MTAMHLVLTKDERVRIICGYLHPGGCTSFSLNDPLTKTLRAFACAHQGVSDIALDVLWEWIGIEALYALFPPPMITKSRNGTKMPIASFVPPHDTKYRQRCSFPFPAAIETRGLVNI